MLTHRELLRPVAFLVAASLAAPALHAADFNGDGYADLAIGCPGEWVNGQQEAGAVHVFMGGPGSFPASGDFVITEASFPDIAAPDDFELFGLAVTSGDFDNDGYDDLVICAGNEAVDGFTAAGTVFVVYGSASGLDLLRHDSFNQNTKGIKDKVEPGNFSFPELSAEQFGRTLAAGDFNGDQFDDLALYVVETFGSKKKPKSFAGAIHVLKGGPDGLTTKGNKLLRQGKGGVPGKCQESANFGWSLVAADFNDDGLADLAVGAPGSTVTPGCVAILYGKLKKGLTGKKSTYIDETTVGGTVEPNTSHQFGIALAAGAFAGGSLQLAIGASALDVGEVQYAGGVYVVRLSGNEVDSVDLITRETDGLEGGVHEGAAFGTALESGDFDGDGDEDLAIGCPGDLVGTADGAGSVTLVPGSPSGLFTAGSLLLHQDVTGVPETAEPDDGFGDTLAAADYDDDGRADLIVGADHENISGVGTAGGILIAMGQASELLDLAASTWLDKSSPAIPGSPVSNEMFGFALGD